MRTKAISNEQLRKLALPLGASVIAAVGTMFVPTGLLETITGATGLSELVPATAAPLGDTARALIAFGAGAFTLAIASTVAFRSDAGELAAKPIPNGQDDMQYKTAPSAKPSLADRIGSFRMPHIKLPKMPWIKGEGDVTELSDLPQLRTADAHPDAPSRRPLSATNDLPAFELTPAHAEAQPEAAPQSQPMPLPSVAEVSPQAIDPAQWYGSIAAQSAPPVEIQPEPQAEPETKPEIAAPVAPQMVEPAPEPESAPVAPAAAPAPGGSLEDMLADLQAAIARREALLSTRSVEVVPVAAPAAEPTEQSAPRFTAPPLSAVPGTNKAQEEMDSALAAALATLHRMNGTSR